MDKAQCAATDRLFCAAGDNRNTTSILQLQFFSVIVDKPWPNCFWNATIELFELREDTIRTIQTVSHQQTRRIGETNRKPDRIGTTQHTDSQLSGLQDYVEFVHLSEQPHLLRVWNEIDKPPSLINDFDEILDEKNGVIEDSP